MIEAAQLMQKMGKEKFTQFVLNNKDKERTGAERAHANRFGKNVRHRKCEHGVWVIENFEPKPCKGCHKDSNDAPAFVVHSHEYFNMGTGTYGTTSEHRKYAKSKGLTECG